MLIARMLFPSGLVVALLMGVPRPGPIGDARGADPPVASKLMFQAPRGWILTRFSDSVLFYDAPGLKRGEHCRVSVLLAGHARIVPHSHSGRQDGGRNNHVTVRSIWALNVRHEGAGP